MTNKIKIRWIKKDGFKWDILRMLLFPFKLCFFLSMFPFALFKNKDFKQATIDFWKSDLFENMVYLKIWKSLI